MTELKGLAAYFSANRYTGTYNIGDRVFGHWNKIPFIGSVGNDRVINEIEGPRVTVHLDLPIKFSNALHYVVLVKPQEIKRLKNFD